MLGECLLILWVLKCVKMIIFHFPLFVSCYLLLLVLLKYINFLVLFVVCFFRALLFLENLETVSFLGWYLVIQFLAQLSQNQLWWTWCCTKNTMPLAVKLNVNLNFIFPYIRALFSYYFVNHIFKLFNVCFYKIRIMLFFL